MVHCSPALPQKDHVCHSEHNVLTLPSISDVLMEPVIGFKSKWHQDTAADH